MKNSDTAQPDYKLVATDEREKRVSVFFHSIASKYDLINDMMTGGIHRLWKRYTITLSGAHHGQIILDLAGGTGDLAMRFSKLVGQKGQVVLADTNETMLQVASNRIAERNLIDNISILQTDAEQLPFAKNTFDCITIAFGLHNITNKQKALESMNQALKPGGKLIVLGFSKPKSPLLNKIYDAYSFKVLPIFDKWIIHNNSAYRYLAESIRMHPDQKALKRMLQKAGLRRVECHNLSGGIVTVHRGFKA